MSPRGAKLASHRDHCSVQTTGHLYPGGRGLRTEQDQALATDLLQPEQTEGHVPGLMFHSSCHQVALACSSSKPSSGAAFTQSPWAPPSPRAILHSGPNTWHHLFAPACRPQCPARGPCARTGPVHTHAFATSIQQDYPSTHGRYHLPALRLVFAGCLSHVVFMALCRRTQHFESCHT